MRGSITKVKKYATYSLREIGILFVFAISIGFILSFDKWGADAFDVGVGLFNLVYYMIISLFILFTVTYVQKFVGAHTGVNPHFHFSIASLLIPLFVVFVTAGAIPFFILPGFTTTENLSMMLGRNRYRRGFIDYLKLGVSGSIFLIVCAVLFSTPVLKDLFYGVNTTFFLFALFSLIPFDLLIKPFDKGCGVSNASGIFYCSRSMYVFSLFFLLIAFVLSKTTIFFLTILLSILFAFILALFYFLYEHKIFGDS